MRRIVLAAGIVIGLAGLVAWNLPRPSNDRIWIEPHARTPAITRGDGRITIDGVRDFAWPDSGPPAPRWDVRSYDLDAIRDVAYIVTPFDTEWRGPAHAFLSFGFDDGSFLSVSVEARREVGEEYSMVQGMLKRFELIYVFGDERDLIGSRVLRQDDDVFLYPVKASRERVRALFLRIVERAEALSSRPEFYGTLRNNCTTAILGHVNAVADEPVRWGLRILLPGYSDALALERGLLDVAGPIEAARARHRINDKVRRFAGAADFSTRIRETTDLGARVDAPR